MHTLMRVKKVDVRACGFIYFVTVAPNGPLCYLRIIHMCSELTAIVAAKLVEKLHSPLY